MSHRKPDESSDLDLLRGLPEASAEERRALRMAAERKIGGARAVRLLEVLSRSVSREQLARRPLSIGEPFSL